MDKIKKEDSKNVSGGYVELETDLEGNKKMIRAFDNETHEQLAESVLYGAKANDIGAPTDDELISAYQKFDK